jgi:UDP-N-acetyl-D-glucosamine dehydrogenase
MVPDMDSQDVDSSVAKADCVLIITDHKSFDYPKIVASAKLVVDTRNALKGMTAKNIVRL